MQREQHRDGVRRDLVRRVVGEVDDGDAGCRGGREVDRVEPDSGPADDAHARPERRDVIGAEGVRGDDDPVGAGGLARDILGCVESRVAHDRAACRLIVLQRRAAEDLCSRHEFEHQAATLTSTANPRARGRGPSGQSSVHSVSKAWRVYRGASRSVTGSLAPPPPSPFWCMSDTYAEPAVARRSAFVLLAAAIAAVALKASMSPVGLPLPGFLASLGLHCRAIEFAPRGGVCPARVCERRERLAWSIIALGVSATGSPISTGMWCCRICRRSRIRRCADAMYLTFYPAASSGSSCCCGRAAGISGERVAGRRDRRGRARRGPRALLFPVSSTAPAARRYVVTNMAYPIVDLALLGLVACVIGAMQCGSTASWSLLAGRLRLSPRPTPSTSTRPLAAPTRPTAGSISAGPAAMTARALAEHSSRHPA